MKEKIQSRIEYYEKENARLLYMILTLTKTKSKQTVYTVIKENESVIHELKHLLTL